MNGGFADKVVATITTIVDYAEAGGVVVIPIEILALFLWFFVVVRFFTLRRGTRSPVDELATTLFNQKAPNLAAGLDPNGVLSSAVLEMADLLKNPANLNGYALNGILLGCENTLRRYRRGISIIVVLAPLLGLLGTVTGMIATFESLNSSAGDGGIAGGISEALITTQLGLGVAIPGLLAARVLERREQRLRGELKDLSEAFKRMALNEDKESAE
ncbi:MAG TPA: MotA/TolQ/ExbB proton channel family protein [Oligoflexales bacterium]|jgi:biopolymer transport protein ExbB|nr:MotA/TolQ/ExbB proton channel family protein [Oligoflexales bacterium]